MKTQINPGIKAHLIRAAFYLFLLLALWVIPFALGQRQAHAQRPPKSSRPVPGDRFYRWLGGGGTAAMVGRGRRRRYGDRKHRHRRLGQQ